MAVDRDDDFSLAAQSDCSYRIALASGLPGYGGQK